MKIEECCVPVKMFEYKATYIYVCEHQFEH